MFTINLPPFRHFCKHPLLHRADNPHVWFYLVNVPLGGPPSAKRAKIIEQNAIFICQYTKRKSSNENCALLVFKIQNGT